MATADFIIFHMQILMPMIVMFIILQAFDSVERPKFSAITGARYWCQSYIFCQYNSDAYVHKSDCIIFKKKKKMSDLTR